MSGPHVRANLAVVRARVFKYAYFDFIVAIMPGNFSAASHNKPQLVCWINARRRLAMQSGMLEPGHLLQFYCLKR